MFLEGERLYLDKFEIVYYNDDKERNPKTNYDLFDTNIDWFIQTHIVCLEEKQNVVIGKYIMTEKDNGEEHPRKFVSAIRFYFKKANGEKELPQEIINEIKKKTMFDFSFLIFLTKELNNDHMTQIQIIVPQEGREKGYIKFVSDDKNKITPFVCVIPKNEDEKLFHQFLTIAYRICSEKMENIDKKHEEEEEDGRIELIKEEEEEEDKDENKIEKEFISPSGHTVHVGGKNEEDIEEKKTMIFKALDFILGKK